MELVTVTYHMSIAGVERDLPICPLNDELSIAAFVIFGDVELTVASAKALLEIAPDYDYLLTAEAKGIPLVHEMARQSGRNTYILARKKAKAYMQGVVETQVQSITTAGVQQLFLDRADAEKMKGKRILIVDDVISTGESLHALEVLVDQVGGTIVGRMAILAEGDAQDRDDIFYLEKLPLFNADGSVKA
jgi:adenine phosphoribosyltransferase